MEVTGTLKVKFDTQVVSDKFQKRDFVLTIGDTYPQHVQFQLTQDKVSKIDNINDGDPITVHFNLRGREYNGSKGIQYFNTLEAWKIENNIAKDVPSERAAPKQNDDLPF